MALPSALPEGWDTYGPGEKIDFYNTVGVTPDDFLSLGIPQSDIDWMWNNGYNIGKPQPIIQQPVEQPVFTRPDSPSVIIGEPEEPVVFNPEPYVPPYQEPVIQQPVFTPATPEPVVDQPTFVWDSSAGENGDWTYVTPSTPEPIIQQPVIQQPVIQQPVVTAAPVVDTRRNDINNLYQTLLGREGDAGGLDFWTGTGLSLDDIANYFKDTDEYRARNAPVVTQAPVATPVVVAATPQPIYNEDLTGDLVVKPGEGIFGLDNLILPNVPGIDLRDTIGDTVDTGGGFDDITGAPITDYSGGDGSGYTDLGGYQDLYEPNIPNDLGLYNGSDVFDGGNQGGTNTIGSISDTYQQEIDASTPEVTSITYPTDISMVSDIGTGTQVAGGGTTVLPPNPDSDWGTSKGVNAALGENSRGQQWTTENIFTNIITTPYTDRNGMAVEYTANYDQSTGRTYYETNIDGQIYRTETRPEFHDNFVYLDDRSVTYKDSVVTPTERVEVVATAEPVATVKPVITFAPPLPVITRPGFPVTPEVTVEVTPEPTPTATSTATPEVTEIVPATPEATIEATLEPEPTIVPATPEPPPTPIIETTPIPEPPVVTVAPPPPQTPVPTTIVETPVITIVPQTPVVTPIIETPIVTEIVPATPEVTVEVTPEPTIVPETPVPTIVATPEVTIVPATPEVTPIVETLPPETPVATIVPETPTVTATPGPTSTPTITSTPEGTPDITATPIIETPVVTELVPATPEATIVPETPTVTTTPGPTELPPVTTLVPATPEVTPIVETPGPTGTATPATPTPGVTETPGPSGTPIVTELVPATPEVTTIVETPRPTPSETITTPPETTLVPATPEVTDTPEPTATPTASPTATPTATPTSTPTLPPETTLVPATPEVTDTPEPSATIETSPTPEPTDTPEVSESPEPSPTPSPTPSETIEQTPEPTPTATQTVLVPPTPTPTQPRPTYTPVPTTLPPTPTPTTQRGRGLAPGLVEATDFYKTYSPVQSKFSWGAQPFQYGPTYSPEVRQAGVGAQTPWGLQQMFQDLSYKDIMDIVSGRQPVSGPVVPNAQRIRPYDASIANAAPEAQVVLNPNYVAQNRPSSEKITGATAVTPVDKQDPRYMNVVSALGADWEQQQQAAADRGDWAEYYRIANLVNMIMQQQETGD